MSGLEKSRKCHIALVEPWSSVCHEYIAEKRDCKGATLQPLQKIKIVNLICKIGTGRIDMKKIHFGNQKGVTTVQKRLFQMSFPRWSLLRLKKWFLSQLTVWSWLHVSSVRYGAGQTSAIPWHHKSVLLQPIRRYLPAQWASISRTRQCTPF